MILRFGHIIQLFTVLLTAILISLFFGVLMLVGKIQGTARVVNYAGLVRGKTQRIVKLEIPARRKMISSAMCLLHRRPPLRQQRAESGAAGRRGFQTKMTALSGEFDDLKNEFILVRQHATPRRPSSPRASISSRPATRPPTWPRSTPRSGPRPSTFWKKSSSRTSWGCCFCSVIRSSRPCGTRP